MVKLFSFVSFHLYPGQIHHRFFFKKKKKILVQDNSKAMCSLRQLIVRLTQKVCLQKQGNEKLGTAGMA